MSLIANVELEICSVETQAAHPELFHYTRVAAFESIVKSNTFWASHYRDMADQTEVLLMRKRLPAAIAPRFDEIVSSTKLTRVQRRLWKKSGGGLGTARDLVNSLYGATFDNRSDIVTAMDAFMTSFSTHTADGDFQREHGAGASGGLCRTRRFLHRARHGRSQPPTRPGHGSRYWAHLKLDSVRYGDAPIDELSPEAGRRFGRYAAAVFGRREIRRCRRNSF